MAARRADTPQPPVASRGLGGLQDPAVASQAPAAPVRQQQRFDCIARRKHTDVCACIVFLALTAGLCVLAVECRKIGQLKRLTNGFDFQGHLCGTDVGNLTSAGGEGDLLLWCSDDGEHRWTTPICVKECPRGNESILCPEKKAHHLEREEKQWDGSVTLSLVKKHRLKPVKAEATYKFNKFCLPQDFTPSDVLPSDMTTFMAEFAGSLSSMQDAWELYFILVIVSLLAGLFWVHVLQSATLALVSCVFVVTSMMCAAFGIQVLIVAVQSGAFGSADASQFSSAASAATKATKSAIGVFTQSGWRHRAVAMELAAVDALGFMGANVQAAIGISCVAIGFILLLYFAFARHTITVSVDCMREACTVFKKLPTLAALPLVQLVFHALALAFTAGGLVLLLSTAEVESKPGGSIVGLHRHFQWSGALAGGVFSWVFAFFWYQELAQALINFVLSWTAAHWYFEGDKGLALLPIVAGLRVAFLYHLGSLALGAMIMAVVRMLVWAVRLLHKHVNDKEDMNKCIKCLVGLLDCFLTMCEAVARRISEAAYTEIALSSEPFFDASLTACELLANNAQVVVTGTWLLRSVIMGANLIYSGLYGCAVYSLLTVPPGRLGELGKMLPNAFIDQWDDLRNPAISALLAAAVCFSTVLSFQMVLNGTADAILYCFLWDRRDGVADGCRVPDSFEKLINNQINPQAVPQDHLKTT
mmetsp:Transcript_91995/g.168699  ORF Transcript_91995/g.168699 Transcript_91995/m.168699 type:complete len:703 (-) Transcript_91995:196-2304(-)